ncbi:porin, partial [Prochlorococcus marinus str. MU1412]|nr:porin [Prochlorococcus marinus str. MU1412]
MKLFKSLLVAPATIGLLAPFSVFAGEANLNDISKYSNLEHLDLTNAFVNDEPKNNSLLAGGEGLVDSSSHDGGFSETTTASFSVDAVLGAVDGAGDTG